MLFEPLLTRRKKTCDSLVDSAVNVYPIRPDYEEEW